MCTVFLFLIVFASIFSLYANAFNPMVSANRNLGFLLRATHKLDGNTIQGDLTPVSNNVLVKVKEALASTAGGIIIPDNAKEKPTDGTVVAVGPGRIHPESGVQMEMAVKVGDNVIYGKFDGSELKYDEKEHQVGQLCFYWYQIVLTLTF